MTATPEPTSPSPSGAALIQEISHGHARALACLLEVNGVPATYCAPNTVDTGRILAAFTPTEAAISFRDPHDAGRAYVRMVIPGPWTIGSIRLIVTGLHLQHMRTPAVPANPRTGEPRP